MKHIAVIGAFDRYNYGDVLMPIVFTKYMQKNFDKDFTFHYYGLKKSNMTYCKGYNCEALRNAYKHKFHAAILIGGEVLSCCYTDMLLCLITSKKIYKLVNIANQYFPILTNQLIRICFGLKYPHPWILKNSIAKIIVYNTIGGNLSNSKKHLTASEFEQIKLALKNSPYISLRANKTQHEFKSLNQVELYPDSVTLISSLITEEEIFKNIKNSELTALSKQKYYVLHVNHSIGKQYIKPLISQIKAISKETNLKCVLLPIAYVLHLDDTTILSTLHHECRQETIYFDFLNTYETLYVLKHSQLYIGSSLHGAITAMSYGIPHCAISKEATKLINYIRTWDSSKYHYAIPQKLSTMVKNLYYDEDNKQHTKTKSQELICLSNEHFEKMTSIICK